MEYSVHVDIDQPDSIPDIGWSGCQVSRIRTEYPVRVGCDRGRVGIGVAYL